MNWNPMSWFNKRGGSNNSGRKPAINAYDAYDGAFPDVLKTSDSDPRGDDNTRLALVGEIVDVSVNHEIGDEGVKMDVQEGAEAAQAYLDDFLVRSNYQVAIRKAAYHGAVTGHRYLKLIVENGQPSRVQVVASDTVEVSTDPRDMDRVLSYGICWSDKDVDRKELIERSENGWTITQMIRHKGGGHFIIDRGAIDPVVEWPYPNAPLYDCQNLTNPNGYLGKADITRNAIDTNQSINALYSLAARILRNHADPKVAVHGWKPQERREIGKSAGSQNSQGAPEDEIKWDVTGTILLPKDTSITYNQYSADGVTALLALAGKLEGHLRTTTRTPEIASGRMPSTSGLLGTDLTVLFAPLSAKTAEKRVHMSGMLVKLCQDILYYAGFGTLAVRAVWPDSSVRNQKEEREVISLDLANGLVSKETASGKLGYEWTEEQRRIEEESAGSTDGILSALQIN